MGESKGVLGSDTQEYNDACDIVDGSVLFLPALNRLLNDSLGRLLRRVVQVVRHDDVGGLFVRNELPNTVARENYELIALHEIHFENLWRSDNAHLGSGLITE